jgi:hypothetical protein
VLTEQGAALFLAAARGGKSTMAASFAAAGSTLISDDLVGLAEDAGEWRVLPGPARLKLAPGILCHLGLKPETLASVEGHPDKRWLRQAQVEWVRFSEDPCRLHRIYLLARVREVRSGSCGPLLEALTPLEAVQEVLRHGLAAGAAEVLGSRADRMERIARLAESVPLRRVTYPRGFECLGRVRDAVLTDLAGPDS